MPVSYSTAKAAGVRDFVTVDYNSVLTRVRLYRMLVCVR